MLATMTLPLTGKFYCEFTCDNTAAGNPRDSVGIGDYTQPFGYILSSNNYVNYLGFSGAVTQHHQEQCLPLMLLGILVDV